MARYDLTRASVINGTDRFSVVQHVRDLRGDRTQIYGMNLLPTQGHATYMVRTIRRRTGSVTADVVKYNGGEVVNLDCAVRARWSPQENRIKVSFARGCVTENGALKTQLMIGAGNGTEGDPADFTKVVRVGQN